MNSTKHPERSLEADLYQHFFFKFDGRESITLFLRNGFWSMWITVATMCFSELGGIGWHWVAMGSATGFSLVEGMGQFKRM